MPLTEQEHRILSNFKTDIHQGTDATSLIPDLWGQGILSEENIMEIQSQREYGYDRELQRLLEIYERNATNLKPLADTLMCIGGFYDLALTFWPEYDKPREQRKNAMSIENKRSWDVLKSIFRWRKPKHASRGSTNRYPDVVTYAYRGGDDDRNFCTGPGGDDTYNYARNGDTSGPSRGSYEISAFRRSYSEGPVVLALGGHGVSDTFEYYDDPQNPSHLSLRTERWGHSASTMADGRIVVMGGSDINHNFSSSTDVFDPVSGDWHPGLNMTIGRSQAVSGLLHGRTFIFGGLGEISSEYLDLEKHKWVQTSSMNKKRWGASAVSLGDGIHILGGRLGGPTVTTNVEIFTPGASYPWIVSKPLPAPRTLLSGCAMDESCMLICGGMDSRGRNLDNCLLFDVREGQWHETGKLIQKCSEHEFVKCGEKFLAMGGVGMAYRPMSVVQQFEPRMMVWNESRPLFVPRHTFAASVICPVMLRGSVRLETLV